MFTNVIPNQAHVYAENETLVVVARGNLFMPRICDLLPVEKVSDLKIILLTVTQAVVVTDGVTDKKYYGYLASGSDGFLYGCQSAGFDSLSNWPYSNWLRKIHVHNADKAREERKFFWIKADESIEKEVVPKGALADEGIMFTVDAASRFMTQDAQLILMGTIAKQWPECELFMCQELEKPSFHHSSLGWQYRKHGCVGCNQPEG